MSDYWNFYRLRVDDEPASIYVDIGIGSSASVSGLSELFYLRTHMLRPREDGLSSQDEFDDLIAIEDDLTSSVDHFGKAIYVGRNTSSGNRDFYVYAADAEFQKVLADLISRWPAYRFEAGTRTDADWSTYWRFLYPSPADFQRMGNRDVVKRLVENGDDLEKPRQIDHFALFKDETGRAAFLRFLRGGGYTISGLRVEDEGEFSVEFDRVDAPKDIDEITIELDRAAREHRGVYDGWGCTTKP